MREDDDRGGVRLAAEIAVQPGELGGAQVAEAVLLEIDDIDERDELDAGLLERIPAAAGRDFAEPRQISLAGLGVEDVVLARVRFKVMRRMLTIRQSAQFQQMAAAKMSGEALFAFLDAHPNLRDRIASIVGAIEDSEGNLKEADAAEELIVEEMQLLGREALQGGADRQVELTEREIRQQPHMHRQGEKKSAGIRKSAISRS